MSELVPVFVQTLYLTRPQSVCVEFTALSPPAQVTFGVPASVSRHPLDLRAQGNMRNLLRSDTPQ